MLDFYIRIKEEILTIIVEKDLLPAYLKEEFSEDDADISIEESDFLMTSHITKDEAMTVFTYFDKEISTEITDEFFESQKRNSFESLLERDCYPGEIDKKYSQSINQNSLMMQKAQSEFAVKSKTPSDPNMKSAVTFLLIRIEQQSLQSGSSGVNNLQPQISKPIVQHVHSRCQLN